MTGRLKMYKVLRPILSPILKILHTILMSKWMSPVVDPLVWLYMKIAEPRVIRLMQFGVYICMTLSGLGVLLAPPRDVENVLGQTLTLVFGIFIFFGALAGAVSVLPGLWWLERAGVLSLLTGLAIFMVVIDVIGASPGGLIVALAFALTFGQRWMEIRKYQLAPRIE